MNNYNDKNVFITGASNGIGKSLALKYASLGANVFALGRNIPSLEKLYDEAFEKYNKEIVLIDCDINDHKKIKTIAYSIFQEYKKIDILILNAGEISDITPVNHITELSWSKIINTNLNANWNILTNFHPLLLSSSHPKVIATSTSDAVIDGRAYWGAYSVSKSGLETLIKIYASENENTSNIKANIVDPGKVNTKCRNTVYPNEDKSLLLQPDDVVDIYIKISDDEFNETGQKFYNNNLK